MNNKITPKDFFLHLGATIVLYSAVIALINLTFSIINYLKPDVLAGSFYAGSIAWPISMLIVLVPLLYLLEWLIARDMEKTPEKKDIWIRRWRIYLTLFLAAALIGGDLITLLNTYFNGEITSRFVYKILAIFIIAGTVGKYYFFSLYTNFKWSRWSTRFHTWFALIIVMAAIVGGFLIVGSPSKQRQFRFDAQRVNDLENIQYQVIYAWQRNMKLPATLTELNDPTANVYIPSDPETKQPYSYSIKADKVFELCANFGLESQDVTGKGAYGGGMGGAYPVDSISYPYPRNGTDSWAHKAGQACFERTIDPTKFPPYKENLE